MASDSNTGIEVSARRLLRRQADRVQKSPDAITYHTHAAHANGIEVPDWCPYKMRVANLKSWLRVLLRMPIASPLIHPPLVDIVGVGLNALDTIIRLPQFPAFNSKMEILSSNSYPGGQVASALVACQRWGLRTRYIGKIGDDFAGRVHREEFAREEVEAHLIEVPHCESQLSYILVERSSGERTVLWKRDARLDISPAELRPEWIERARLLHVDGHPTAPAIAAARMARQAGISVMADLDNLYEGVEVLLEHIDYLISSREFPERVTGIPDLMQAILEIRRRFGCKIVGATLGIDGALAWDGHAFHYSPAFRVDAVDTTGAGDIFHAAFAYALLKGTTLKDILDFSCAAAALNCTGAGARGGIQSLKEIHEVRDLGSRHASIFSDRTLRTFRQRKTHAK